MEFRLVMYRGKYAAEWREGGQQHRRSLRTADRGVALQRLEAFSAEANKPQDDRIKTLMEAYLKDKPSDTAKFSAQALLPFWGSYTAGQISTDLCRRYTESRRKLGRGDGTILREMGVLKAAVRRYASKAGAVFEMPSSPPPKDRYLTKAEFRKLVDAASDTPHLRLFLLVAVATAARAGAVLDLTWDRVNFARRQINLGVSEGNKRRAIVPMTRGLESALRDAHKKRLSEYVVEFGGEKVGSVKKSFAKAVARAGLDDVTPHVLRHTAAVWMAEARTPMAEIAQYLGHSKETVTFKIYARFSPDYLRGAASALEWDEISTVPPSSDELEGQHEAGTDDD
jgi:integrase